MYLNLTMFSFQFYLKIYKSNFDLFLQEEL